MLVALLSLAVAGCHTDRCNTPFGEGATIDLYQPDFVNLLQNPGATLVINRGYKGILVHCVGLNEYVAFDCACPVCHDMRLLPDDSKTAAVLSCGQCGSSYELYYGNPLDGAASPCPLYAYQTLCDGRYLSIY